MRISNQRPIAEKAARHFSEDIRRLVHSYASFGIPRHTFVEPLESCMAVGMTKVLTSVIEMLFAWSESGVIQKACEQIPPPCSWMLQRVAGQLRYLPSSRSMTSCVEPNGFLWFWLRLAARLECEIPSR